MIHIHSRKPLLGDCLAQLPFMCAVAEARGDRVRLTGGFNRHIAPLLEPLPIVFEPEGSGTGAEFTLQAWPAYQTGLRTKLHMVQCYFHDFGWPVPAMPIAPSVQDGTLRSSAGYRSFSVQRLGSGYQH